MRTIIACLLAVTALPLMAQVYKYHDANGNLVFTDQPPEGRDATPVQLAAPNTVPAPASGTNQEPSASVADPTPKAPYAVLSLSGLDDQEALRANNGTFSVTVNLTPPLASSHALRLVLDDAPYDQPSRALRRQLTNIDRGDHSLAVQVLVGDQVVQTSPAHPFTVQRISTHSPSRP